MSEKSPSEESAAEKSRPLTEREARFVEQYRLHGNAARAAREAGYAARQAGAIGWKTLRRPRVIAALRAHGIEIVLTPQKKARLGSHARTYRRQGLTLLQERFVAQYLIDGNGTQAAIRAGLPARDPGHAAVKMLRHRAVAKAIERERAAAQARLGITADRVKAELAAIAFANIADVADWGPDGLTLKQKQTVSKADQAAIAKLSTARVEKTGATHAEVKMHSKLAALDALAKLLGLYGRGARAPLPTPEEGERRDANALLRARLLKIAAQKSD